MSLLRELRKRARLVVGPVLGVSLIVYFAYHLVEGDRGLKAWARASEELREAKGRLAAAQATRATLEHRVSLLRTEHLDRDMLDERARAMLNLAAPDEIVIFEPSPTR